MFMTFYSVQNVHIPPKQLSALGVWMSDEETFMMQCCAETEKWCREFGKMALNTLVTPSFKLRIDNKLLKIPKMSHNDEHKTVSNDCWLIDYSDLKIWVQEKLC